MNRLSFIAALALVSATAYSQVVPNFRKLPVVPSPDRFGTMGTSDINCPPTSGDCAPIVTVSNDPTETDATKSCTATIDFNQIIVAKDALDVPIIFTLKKKVPADPHHFFFDTKAIQWTGHPPPDASQDASDQGLSPQGDTYTIVAKNKRAKNHKFKIHVNHFSNGKLYKCPIVDPTIVNRGTS